MDLCLDMEDHQEQNKELSSSLSFSRIPSPRRDGLDHTNGSSALSRTMVRQHLRLKEVIAVAMILSLLVTARFHAKHMDPSQIVYQRSMEAIYPPNSIVRDQQSAATSTTKSLAAVRLTLKNNTNTTKRRPHRKPHGPSILNVSISEPATYGGPITAGGRMQALTKEMDATRDGLKLRRIYYFNSFFNPKRKELMEQWLEPLGVPYDRVEPMLGNQTYCGNNKNCLSSIRLTASYRHLLEPALSHVHDISGTVLIVDNDDTFVDMRRLDQFLTNFTEKWQVLRLDCNQPSPDNPDAIWYPQQKHDHPSSHECVQSNAILYRRGSLDRLQDRLFGWNQIQNRDINCRLGNKNMFKTICVNLGITKKRKTKGMGGVARNSWVLSDKGWTLDEIRREAAFEPTDDPNTMIQIDRIYYHNMDKNDLRRQHMESWLNEQPIPYKRIPAKVGSPEDICVGEKNTPNRCRGTAGILKTLTSIIENENTTGVSLVMEDDVIIVDKKDRLARMEEAIKYVPDDWDIIRFDCWGSEDFDTPAINGFVIDSRLPKPKPSTVDENGNWPPFCGGAYAMLWRDSSVHKLKKMWSMIPADDADCIIASTEYVQSYCVNIGLFEHYYITKEMSDVSMLRD